MSRETRHYTPGPLYTETDLDSSASDVREGTWNLEGLISHLEERLNDENLSPFQRSFIEAQLRQAVSPNINVSDLFSPGCDRWGYGN